MRILKKLYITFLVLLLFESSFGQIQYQLNPIPTAEVFVNTFPIKTDTLSGTSFVVEVDNMEYLITAKHLFKTQIKSGDSTNFSIRKNNRIISLSKRIFYHKIKGIDIAVLPLDDNKIQELHNYKLGTNNAIIGQECFFFGYPFWGIHSNLGGVVYPFVKKGILSAIMEEKGIVYYYVDAHNNPGFSGGPVIFYNFYKSEYRILGVISAYWPQQNIGEVSVTNTDKRKFNYNENSGIMIMYQSELIEDIIQNLNN